MPATPDKLEATNGCDEDKTDGSEEERGKPISGLPSWRGIQWPEAARRLADKASLTQSVRQPKMQQILPWGPWAPGLKLQPLIPFSLGHVSDFARIFSTKFYPGAIVHSKQKKKQF